MTWIIFGLLSHFGWAWANIIDKYVIKNHVPNIWHYFVWTGLISVAVLPLIPIFGFHWPPLFFTGLAIAGTLFSVAGTMVYFRVVSLEEIIRINIWWNLIPLFVLIIGWWGLGEHLTAWQFVAFGVLMVGAVLASLHVATGKRLLTFSKAFGLMVISCLFYAMAIVIARYVLLVVPFTDYTIIGGLVWVVMAALPLLKPAFRRSFSSTARRLPTVVVVGIIASVIVSLFSGLASQAALSLTPAALVYALEGSQSVFVFIIGVGIALIAPRALAEHIDRKNLAIKLAALVIMIAGVALLHATT